MAGSLMQLLGLFDDDDDPVETQPRRNAGAVAPRHNGGSVPELPHASHTNMRGLINNTGYTKGNGNGSIVFGGFDNRTLHKNNYDNRLTNNSGTFYGHGNGGTINGGNFDTKYGN